MSVDDRWEEFVREQILDIASRPHDWIGMVDLRPRLDLRGTSRHAQDYHLRRLSLAGKLNLAPAPDCKQEVLREPDDTAAVYLGGDACHIIRWDGA